MSAHGYPIRIGQISYAASDEKGWYGVHFYGFGPKSALKQVELQPSFGFAARPVDASNDNGCNGFYSLDGEFAFLGHDARFSDKCPSLTQGSSAQWNSNGAYALLDTETNTWSLFIPRPSGGSHVLTVGENGDGEVIAFSHAKGTKITIKGDTVTIEGANVTIGGSSADFVALAGKTDAEFSKVWQYIGTHIHPCGVGPTGTPLTPAPPAESVACSKLATE